MLGLRDVYKSTLEVAHRHLFSKLRGYQCTTASLYTVATTHLLAIVEVRYHLPPYDEGQSWIILALMSGTLYNPTYPCAFFIEEMTGSIQDVRHECRDDYVHTNSPFLTTYPAHSITQAS